MSAAIFFDLRCNFDRLVRVMTSPMYARMFLGAFSEGTGLWYWLASPVNRLDGDPIDWTYEQTPSLSGEYSLKLRHADTEFLVGAPYARAAIHPIEVDFTSNSSVKYLVRSRQLLFKSEYVYQMTLKNLDPESRTFAVVWQRRKSGLESISASWDAYNNGTTTITCQPIGETLRIWVKYESQSSAMNTAHEVITREMTYIDDIVAHRDRLKAHAEEALRIETQNRIKAQNEAQERALEDALAREKAEDARRQMVTAALQDLEGHANSGDAFVFADDEQARRFAERSEWSRQELSRFRRTGGPLDDFRLSNDLCLECGQPIIVRRNNQYGHIFFGCSDWSPKAEERKCNGARPATCDVCHKEMLERTNFPGPNVLRCEDFPHCGVTRQIPDSLEIHKWLSGRRVPSHEIRNDFRNRGLLGPSRS